MGILRNAITTSLLLTLSANAQQSASPFSFPTTTQTPESTVHSSPAPSPEQPAATSASILPVLLPSATMDQVVDRAIEREHALMEMLKTRTPLVETYLQDLKFDPQVGPAPVQDHYFLGRMDLGERVDRRDYLSKDTSFERHLLGGFTKLY